MSLMRSPHSGFAKVWDRQRQAGAFPTPGVSFFLFPFSSVSTTVVPFFFFCWLLLLCYHACHVNADDMQSTFYLS